MSDDNVHAIAFGGKKNVEQTLIEVQQEMAKSPAEVMVIIWRDREGYIHTGHSSGSMSEKLGFCAVAQAYLLSVLFGE